MSITTGLLTKQKFSPIFLCQLISAFGDNFIRTSFATLITYYSLNLSDFTKLILITLALAVFVAPYCLISATGGKIADKYKKSSVIRWLKLINVGMTIIVAFGFLTNNYFILLVSIFLIGVEASLFGPVKYSILPESLDKKELIAGNGLIEAGTFIGILMGILLGGVIISSSIISVILVCIIAIGAAIMEYIVTLFIPNSKRTSPEIKLNPNFVLESINCVKFVKQNHKAFLAILGISWFWLIGGVFIAEMPNLTSDVFKADKSVLTMLLIIFSVGTGVGSLLCNKLLNNEISTKYVPTSMVLMSFFMFDLWWTSEIFTSPVSMEGIHYFLSNFHGVRASIDILMVAITGGVYIVPLYAVLQTSFDKQNISQAIAGNNILNSIFMVSASLLTIALYYLGLSVSNILFIMAVTNFFTASYICNILPDTVIKNFLQIILKLIYRVEVIGLENYEKAGNRVLIIANHASFLDPLLLGVFLPGRHVFAIDTFIAKNWWLKPFLKFLRAFPIDPTNPMAAKALIDKLKSDKNVIIFPEGRLTVTGSLMKIYEGPGLIADKADATLLPIRLDGPQFSLFSRMRGKEKIKLFPKIRIVIHEPKKLNVPNSYFGRDRRHEVGNKLYDIMSEMMFNKSETESTLFETLIHSCKQFGRSREILADFNKTTLTYGKLLISSFVLGKKIADKTSNKEYVGLLLPNSAGAVVTFFSMLLYNRIPAMLNYSAGPKNFISSCKTAKIKSVFTSRLFVEKGNLHHIINNLERENITIHYLEDIRKNITIIDKLVGTYQSCIPERSFRKINKTAMETLPSPNDPAVLLFTSGSEGLPKGVVLSHSNLISNLKQLASRIDFTSHDRLFNALPIFHSFGLTGGLILPLLCGVHTYFYPSPLHYRIIPEMVYGINATIFFATDTFLAGYAKYAHQYDFFSIRYIFAGAEKLKTETRKIWMEKFGIRILEGYGTTETSPAISLNTAMHCKLGTVGRFLPSMRFSLKPVEGIETGGQLIVSGPNVMIGYIRPENPSVIEKPSCVVDGTIWEGWYDTGDIVKVDEDNYITIIGRAKRFVKLGGEMVSLLAIEEAINSLWPDNLHAAIGIEDERKGEVVLLITNKENASKEELISFLTSNGYSELYIPKKVLYIKDMPILGAGKVDYMALKEWVSKEDKGDKGDEQDFQG